MDLNNPVIQLCQAGIRAEFAGKRADAYALYAQAWDAAQSDYEACVAAHYVARGQTDPQAIFWWNQEALRRAQLIQAHPEHQPTGQPNSAQPDTEHVPAIETFLPSLYLNMGRSYELVDDPAQAQHYYALAAQLGTIHQPDTR
ncbi:MAG: hypothetical protein WDZ49_01385 [Litorilinea sp.]